MTDQRPPTDPTDASAEVEARLRAALADRASPNADRSAGVGEADGLADLRRRLGPEVGTRGSATDPAAPSIDLPPVPVAPLPLRPDRWSRSRVLAAAAVVLAIVGTALVLRPGNDDGQVRTVEPRPVDATGWYLPRGLPDGWQLRSARAFHTPTDLCPCSSRTWGTPRLSSGFEVSTLWRTTTDPVRWEEQVALRTDTVGWLQVTEGAGEPRVDVSWGDDLGAARLSTIGLDREEALDRARSLVGIADPEPPDGLVERDAWAIDEPITGYRTITLTYRTASGAEVLLEVGATGTTSGLHNGFEPPLGGDRGTAPGPTFTTAGPGPGGILGRWPGGDVEVSPGPIDTGDEPRATGEDLHTLLDALGPATAAEWRAYVEAAPPDPLSGPLPTPNRAADLLTRPGDPEADPERRSVPATTEAVGGATTTTVVSAPDTEGPGGESTATTAPADGGQREADALLAQFEAFATGREPSVPALGDEVAIGLGQTTDRTVARADLEDPTAWVTEAAAYAGRDGPISPLDLLRDHAPSQARAGLPAGCTQGPARTPPPLQGTAGERLVSIEPAEASSCGLDWFAVVLVLAADGRVTAVHTYLVEP